MALAGFVVTLMKFLKQKVYTAQVATVSMIVTLDVTQCLLCGV